MRISDWSSDVCSSDLRAIDLVFDGRDGIGFGRVRAGHRFLGKMDLRDVAAQERHPLDLDKNISAVRKDVLRALGIVGLDRKSVVWGKSVSVRVDLGGRRTIKKQKD